jgi:hypothetical protein
MRPSVEGVWIRIPNTPASSTKESGSETTTSIPSGRARVSTTSIVCGWQSSATRNLRAAGFFRTSYARCIASAAAVASSRSEAFAIGRPVRSSTIVWKFSSASSRPWLISGWYGVYCVYQPGFSTMLRRRTGGVTHAE